MITSGSNLIRLALWPKLLPWRWSKQEAGSPTAGSHCDERRGSLLRQCCFIGGNARSETAKEEAAEELPFLGRLRDREERWRGVCSQDPTRTFRSGSRDWRPSCRAA